MKGYVYAYARSVSCVLPRRPPECFSRSTPCSGHRRGCSAGSCTRCWPTRAHRAVAGPIRTSASACWTLEPPCWRCCGLNWAKGGSRPGRSLGMGRPVPAHPRYHGPRRPWTLRPASCRPRRPSTSASTRPGSCTRPRSADALTRRELPPGPRIRIGRSARRAAAPAGRGRYRAGLPTALPAAGRLRAVTVLCPRSEGTTQVVGCEDLIQTWSRPMVESGMPTSRTYPPHQVGTANGHWPPPRRPSEAPVHIA
jgi:hypothetical protein